MTKKQARKEAYFQIVKQNKNHQEVFDQLKTTSGVEITFLATIMSGIPSVVKRRNNKTLIVVIILCSSSFILLRILKFWLFFSVPGIEMKSLVIYTFLGVILPVFVIISAIRWKMEPIGAVALLLIFNVIGTVLEEGIQLVDPFELLSLLLQMGIIVLGFMLLFRTRTAFKVKESIVERDGKSVFRQIVTFDDETKMENTGLLDS